MRPRYHHHAIVFACGGLCLSGLPGRAPSTAFADALSLEIPPVQGNVGNPVPFAQWGPETEQIFEQDNRRNDYTAEIHYDLGLFFYEQGAWDLSLTHYRKAMELDPSFSEAYFGIGLLFYTLGDDENALSYYGAALERNPNDADTRNNLGLIHYRRGELELAKTQIEEAIRLQPFFPDAFYNLGLVHYQRKDLEVAAATFKRALDQDPLYLRARFNLGVVYFELGRTREAQEQWNKILVDAPGSDLAAQAEENLSISRSSGEN